MATKVVGESNYRAVLYEFALDTSTTPNGVTIAARQYFISTGYREPDILTHATNGDTDSNLSANGIGLNQAQFKTQLQNEYNEMVESVITNGGFYIGRYETSLDGSGKIQSKKSQAPMNNINWWNMYINQKLYGSEITGVKSSMIWASSWDQVLIFMKDVKNEYASNKPYILDSTGMGNYSGTIGLDTWSSTSGPAPTGCIAVKNIYDMAGNVRDWTIETYDDNNRVSRRRLLRQCR